MSAATRAERFVNPLKVQYTLMVVYSNYQQNVKKNTVLQCFVTDCYVLG